MFISVKRMSGRGEVSAEFMYVNSNHVDTVNPNGVDATLRVAGYGEFKVSKADGNEISRALWGEESAALPESGTQYLDVTNLAGTPLSLSPNQIAIIELKHEATFPAEKVTLADGSGVFTIPQSQRLLYQLGLSRH